MHLGRADASRDKWYRVLTSLVSPRPIAWIATQAADGTRNLAPFSWFQAVCADPPTLMVAFARKADGVLKDTPRNLLATKSCRVYMVPESHGPAMVETSRSVPGDEHDLLPEGFEFGGTYFDCTLAGMQEFGESPTGSTVMYLQVESATIDDSLVESGRVSENPGFLARLGGRRYGVISEDFELQPSGP